MYTFKNPIHNIYTIFFHDKYIGQIILKEKYVTNILLVDYSHIDFMNTFLFEVGKDVIYAIVDKCNQDYYQQFGTK